jgi:hypothetical protein
MAQSRAVLDTNLLYYAARISTETRLRNEWLKDVQAKCNLSLASPTIIEVLTNTSIDEAQVWMCLDVAFSDHFDSIIQIGFAPFDVHAVRHVVDERDSEGLRILRDSSFSLKIACEAEFLRFVEFCLIAGFLHVVIEERRGALTDGQVESLVLHYRALLEANSEVTLAGLTNALVAGYESKSARKAVDAYIQQQLTAFTRVALINLHMALEGFRIDEMPDAPIDVQQRVVAAVQLDPLNRRMREAERAGRQLDEPLPLHPLGILQKAKYRESVNAFLEEMRSDFESHALMPPDVLAFFVNRLTGQLRSGAKYRKNDVFDLLLAFSLVAEDTLLVSNDDGVLEALKDISPDSYALSLSLRR